MCDLAALPDEGLRTKVRSMTTLLAGNPYLAPSEPVEGAVRSIDVVGRVLLVYRICSGANLEFLSVTPYADTAANRKSDRDPMEEAHTEVR
jgi:hypothetical protein